MGLGDTVNKSKKIRIYPNKEQRQIFKNWLGTSRYVYNQTIEYLSKTKEKEHWMKVAKNILDNLPDFCDAVPYQIKKIAIKDAFQSFFLNVKKIKKNGGKFNLGFRSKRNSKQSCYIPKSAVKITGIYPRISGKGLKYAENIPTLIKDSRLVYHSGRWYITIPTEEPPKLSENQRHRVVAIDPGIRTFATFFSDDCFGQIGKHDFGKIVRLCQHLDGLISRMSKSTGQQKRAMKKAAHRLRWRIKDLISELHHKTAKFFTDNFAVIFLPYFETSKMTCKAGRKLNRKSVRSMLSYSFFKFAEHLKHKCFETGTTLIRVNESYTSKMNSFTLKIIPKLGSKEFFEHDGFRINRDINGARNILCFSLVDTPSVRNNIAKVNEN
ncbi:MAG: transposase [Bacteroidales bacterium]|nr:transposase [Bacteroidales bacterium]